jgi:hypothetical protein
MKWALALLLVGVALAGCTAGDDDPAPPNADPNGTRSYPPPPNTSTPPSTDTHTNPPPSNMSSSSSATVAPSGRFGPHDEEDSASDASFSGLMVGGHLTGSGALVHVEAVANNVGERTYRVPDGCGTPWREAMAGPSGAAVAPRPPPAACPSPSYRDLAAHDYLSRTLEWNGTLWDAASGTYVPAPAGTYAWSVTFDAYSGSGTPPPEHAALTLQFQVTVR